MKKIVFKFKIKAKKPRGAMPPRGKVIQCPKRVKSKKACRGLNKKINLTD
jgi:hypothetical protein